MMKKIYIRHLIEGNEWTIDYTPEKFNEFISEWDSITPWYDFKKINDKHIEVYMDDMLVYDINVK